MIGPLNAPASSRAGSERLGGRSQHARASRARRPVVVRPRLPSLRTVHHGLPASQGGARRAAAPASEPEVGLLTAASRSAPVRAQLAPKR